MRVCKCEWGGKTPCVYVGRTYGGYTGSVLGNPYKSGRDGTLDEVLTLYRKWLWGRLSASDPAVLTALRGIKPDDVLGCWCVNAEDATRTPEVCHAQVVWKAWRWLRSQENE